MTANASGEKDTVARNDLLKRMATTQDRVAEICGHLVRAPSGNPPGDTGYAAEAAANLLREVDGADVEIVVSEPPVANVVARLRGSKPGRRLVFNGHLDTFPVGDPSRWSVDPLGGTVKDGRIYGRGVTDMKGGIAASIAAFTTLATVRDAWAGELVVTLAGDEETMGQRGTAFLLDTFPHASGDAMICGDAGSPDVLRFGEKGLLWLDIEAQGRAAHGAHVHRGENAVERLMEALERLRRLSRHRVATPDSIARAIRKARRLSEALSGKGESRVLQSVTVNIGTVSGGTSPNLVPDRACAGLDIRLPAGTSIAEIERRIEELLQSVAGVTTRIRRRFEPSWTEPSHEIVQLAVKNGREALGRTPVVNMRVGASDARLYRQRSIPTIVYGLTPHNMGAPDEYATLSDLYAVAQVHAMTAFDFLSSSAKQGR